MFYILRFVSLFFPPSIPPSLIFYLLLSHLLSLISSHVLMPSSFLSLCLSFRFLYSAAPEQTELADLLRPLSEQIQKVQSFREKHRGSSLFNHLSAVSESIPALGWVAMVRPSPPPAAVCGTDAYCCDTVGGTVEETSHNLTTPCQCTSCDSIDSVTRRARCYSLLASRN